MVEVSPSLPSSQLRPPSRERKTPVGVARVCREMGVPCVAIAGSVDVEPAEAAAHGITAAFSICPGPVSLDHAVRNAAAMLERAAANVLRLYRR